MKAGSTATLTFTDTTDDSSGENATPTPHTLANHTPINMNGGTVRLGIPFWLGVWRWRISILSILDGDRAPVIFRWTRRLTVEASAVIVAT